MNPMWIAAPLMAGSFGLSLSQAIGGGGGGGVDVGGELKRIQNLYDEQRAYAKEVAAQQLTDLNRQASSNLATRGIYDSPVSEYVYGANRAEAQKSLASALAGIAGSEASARSNIFNSLMGYQQQDALRKQQATNQLIAALGGLGSGIMQYGMMRGQAPAVGAGPAGGNSSYANAVSRGNYGYGAGGDSWTKYGM